jgi:hypothetical protein
MSLYIGEQLATTWTGLSGTSEANVTSYLNNATVTHTLYAANRTTAVSGGSGTLAYVTGSDGNYRGTISSTVTLTLTEGAVYWVKYVAVSGDYRGERWEKHRAVRRGKD